MLHTLRNRASSRAVGFTLIELLVVIAIIAVLIALLPTDSPGSPVRRSGESIESTTSSGCPWPCTPTRTSSAASPSTRCGSLGDPTCIGCGYGAVYLLSPDAPPDRAGRALQRGQLLVGVFPLWTGGRRRGPRQFHGRRDPVGVFQCPSDRMGDAGAVNDYGEGGPGHSSPTPTTWPARAPRSWRGTPGGSPGLPRRATTVPWSSSTRSSSSRSRTGRPTPSCSASRPRPHERRELGLVRGLGRVDGAPRDRRGQ